MTLFTVLFIIFIELRGKLYKIAPKMSERENIFIKSKGNYRKTLMLLDDLNLTMPNEIGGFEMKHIKYIAVDYDYFAFVMQAGSISKYAKEL